MYGSGVKSALTSGVARVFPSIPFAGAALLWRMKQTVREKDALDRLFLKEKLAASASPVGAAPPRRDG